MMGGAPGAEYMDEGASEYGNEVAALKQHYAANAAAMQTDSSNALNLKWVLGFNKDIDQGVHFLTDDNRTVSLNKRAHINLCLYSFLCVTHPLVQL